MKWAGRFGSVILSLIKNFVKLIQKLYIPFNHFNFHGTKTKIISWSENKMKLMSAVEMKFKNDVWSESITYNKNGLKYIHSFLFIFKMHEKKFRNGIKLFNFIK